MPTIVTITATFREADNTTACKGAVVIRPLTRIIDTAGKVLLEDTPVTVPLNAAGYISHAVVASDSPGITPSGVGYHITERIQGAPTRSYAVLIPAASTSGTIDLATLAPVVAADARGLLPSLVELAVTVAGKTAARPLDGLTLYVYGHSYTVLAVPYMREVLPARVARRLGMTSSARGRAGDMVRDTVGCMLGYGAPGWSVGTRGLLVLMAMINDLRFGGADPLAHKAFRLGTRAAIAIGNAGTIIGCTNASIVTSFPPSAGVWSFLALADTPAQGGLRFINAASATVTITFTGSEITAMMRGTDATVAAGSATFSVDGVLKATESFGGVMRNDTGVSNPALLAHTCHYPVRLTGLGSGSHTLVITTSNADYVYFEGYVLPSATPPSILVCKDPPLPAASWALYPPFDQGSAAQRLAYAADVDAVVAEFAGSGDVRAADMAPGYTDACTGFDGVHPNDSGGDVLAANIVAGALALPMRAGLGYL